MSDDAYEEAVKKAQIMQMLLQEWHDAPFPRTPEIDLKFTGAMMVEHDIGLMGFPVDWSVNYYYSHLAHNDSSAVIAVIVRRPPGKNSTPRERRAYDEWYKEVLGVSDPEEPQDTKGPDEK